MNIIMITVITMIKILSLLSSSCRSLCSISFPRVYFGGQKCELIEDFDLSIPYNITLDDEGESEYGSMRCQMRGTYVSNINGSFIIEEPYGRSYPEPNVLKVFADNSIAMFQTYASK